MIVRELVTKLGFNIDMAKLAEYDRKIDQTIKKSEKFAQGIKAGATKVRNAGAVMTAGITVPLAFMANSFIKVASDAEEMGSKFNQTFKGMEEDANKFVDTFGEAVGRSDIEIKNSLSAFQAQALGLGFSKEKAFELSKSLQTLSVDFASFNNLSDEEGFSRFISAMSGSSEVVDKFGINLKATALDQELLALGFPKVTKGATEQQKAQARLNIITKALGRQGAIGDAIRTADSYANRLKRMKRETDAMAESWGKLLIPVASKVVQVLTKLAKFMNSLPKPIKVIILVVGGLLAVLGPLLLVFGQMTLAITSLIFFFKTFGIASKVLSIALSPLTLKIGLIVGALALLALAIQDVWVWMEGGNSVIGKLLGPFDEWKNNFIAGIKEIGNVILGFLINPVGEAIRLFKLAMNLKNAGKSNEQRRDEATKRLGLDTPEGRKAHFARVNARLGRTGNVNKSSSQINKTEVNNTIEMKVPAGMSPDEQRTLNQGVTNAVKKAMSEVNTETITSNPRSE